MPAAEFLARARERDPGRWPHPQQQQQRQQQQQQQQQQQRQQRPPPLAYGPGECYYLQAAAPDCSEAKGHLMWGQLFEQLQDHQPTERRAGGSSDGSSGDGSSKAEGEGGGGGGGSIRGGAPPRLSQVPRVWASPAGAVSPLHFDRSPSALAQLTGSKRMLFLDPDQLLCAYTYPETHLLRRRGRVNVCNPDYERWAGSRAASRERPRARAAGFRPALAGGRGVYSSLQAFFFFCDGRRGLEHAELDTAMASAIARTAPCPPNEQVPAGAPPPVHGGAPLTR
jgi:hypothetical protein